MSMFYELSARPSGGLGEDNLEENARLQAELAKRERADRERKEMIQNILTYGGIALVGLYILKKVRARRRDDVGERPTGRFRRDEV